MIKKIFRHGRCEYFRRCGIGVGAGTAGRVAPSRKAGSKESFQPCDADLRLDKRGYVYLGTATVDALTNWLRT